MKINIKELNDLIIEEVKRQKRKSILEARKQKIENMLNEEFSTSESNEKAEDTPSIFDAKPGEIIILNFKGNTIKIQRQLDDLFKIVDAAESKKLKEGDYIKIQGNDSLVPGKEFKFAILRKTDFDYQTNALQSWKIISN